MDSDWSPPLKGQHLFVVLRHDDYVTDPVVAITGTKAYRARDTAEAEATRLNALNADKGARYFVRVVRLHVDPGE